MKYILYGGELSYFTGKARAYLRNKRLDFEERPATRQVYREIILPSVGAPIVPVLATDDGQLVQDTTDIIDFLEQRHPQPSAYPDGPRQKLVALMLEHYADEWLVIPAMHYRWSVLEQQYDFVMGEFGALSAPEESLENQIKIGEKTSAPFRGSIPALGVTEATVPAIEAVYLEFLDQLNAHFADYPYLLGGRPCIADYGLMGPLYAHLGRDPVPRAIMQSRAPAVYDWVTRMNAPSGPSGELLADDQVPASLLPILLTLCRDFLPEVVDVVAHNDAFLEQHPGDDIPRYLGMHSFRTGDAEGERVIHSYSQWMFQRYRDHYQSLTGADRDSVDELLRGLGGLEALQTTIRHRVRRQPGQLELVEEVL
ncbi:MAG: glutathione S-transferase family protein [Halieaceae bacterium]